MLKKIALVATLSGLAVSSFAAAPDFTTLTSSIDFSSVITAVMAVFVALIGLVLALKGAKIVYHAIRGN